MFFHSGLDLKKAYENKKHRIVSFTEYFHSLRNVGTMYTIKSVYLWHFHSKNRFK